MKPLKTIPERLQKLMAAAGLGSRRALEKLIADGKVLVNGEKAELGRTVTAGDTIVFDGVSRRVVSEPVLHRTLIYNKPEGEVTSRSDPQGRATVFDRLPRVRNGRWVAIGRLDMNTTGLLLLTTDGELAHAMMHPSSNVDREYACRIRGKASEEQIQRLKQGVELDDGPASFSDVQEAGGTGENHWYHVTIMEGRNREVRRLWESQGLTVGRLKRVRYGAAFLPKRLRMGQWSEIDPKDHEVLRGDIGLPPASSGLSLKQPRVGAAHGRDSKHSTRGKPTTRSKPTTRGKPTSRSKAATRKKPASRSKTSATGKPWGQRKR